MSATTTIELVWTLVAIAGMLVQGWLLRDSLATRREARRLRRAGQPVDGKTKRIIRAHVREAIGYLFVHVAFVYAGLRALLMSNTVPLTPSRMVTICLFMGGSIALVWLGLQARADRIYVRAHDEANGKEASS